uniref:Uncharacterized protein n=1 Tax=Pithovirus LCPAC406 TaxID=2506599 RepID=A0A481ZCV8_9VIRU|nr:MAG: hypothetical protein LCPAC406_00520 [Pithovirus LCPAC406]
MLLIVFFVKQGCMDLVSPQVIVCIKDGKFIWNGSPLNVNQEDCVEWSHYILINNKDIIEIDLYRHETKSNPFTACKKCCMEWKKGQL